MTEIVALGAGRMGRGIAHVFAFAGHPVTILDFKQRPPDQVDALLAEGKKEIEENLAFLKSLGVAGNKQIESTLSRIRGAGIGEAGDLLGGARYIFEGVTEMLDVKRDAIARASALAGPEAVIASTTSTMLSETLADFSARPENFLNAHFLNPAYLIPLVEVSPSSRTDEGKLTAFMELLTSIGKVPVRCKASPGYIVPRLQSVAMSEACRMVEEGVATAEDIDRAVTAGFGIRYATMGLVEFTDWGGVDILYHANRYLRDALDPRFQTPKIVDDMMERGDLGLKTGKGFYDFSKMDTDAYRREKLATFVALLRHMDLMPKAAGN